MKRLLLGAFVLAGLLWAQQPLVRDADPHNNPGCSPTGSPTQVRCSCLGMVHQVVSHYTEKCWTDKGWTKIEAPEGFKESMYIRHGELRSMEDPNEETLSCLAESVPTHCAIIARVPDVWRGNGVEGIMAHQHCGTACKPERCFCEDSRSCKAHEDTEDY